MRVAGGFGPRTPGFGSNTLAPQGAQSSFFPGSEAQVFAILRRTSPRRDYSSDLRIPGRLQPAL
jgi:hypothetical protein